MLFYKHLTTVHEEAGPISLPLDWSVIVTALTAMAEVMLCDFRGQAIKTMWILPSFLSPSLSLFLFFNLSTCPGNSATMLWVSQASHVERQNTVFLPTAPAKIPVNCKHHPATRQKSEWACRHSSPQTWSPVTETQTAWSGDKPFPLHLFWIPSPQKPWHIK